MKSLANNEAKRWLRSYLAFQRKRQPQSSILSRKACRHFSRSILFKRARCVALFLNFGSEIQTRSLVRSCWAKNKKVLIPDTRRGLKNTTFVEYSSRDRLVRSRYGPLELRNPRKAYPWKKINLIVVPGLGFDGLGYRIGYGGGVYDRLLRKTSRAKKLGIGFKSQLLNSVPKTVRDSRIHGVVHEEGIVSFS